MVVFHPSLLLTLSAETVSTSETTYNICPAILCLAFFIVIVLIIVAAQKRMKGREKLRVSPTHTPTKGVVIARVPPPALLEKTGDERDRKEKGGEGGEKIENTPEGETSSGAEKPKKAHGKTTPKVKMPVKREIPDVPPPATPPRGIPPVPPPAELPAKPPEPSSP